jgi:PIN domain nuclease of toxin-antitoxin system
VNLLLDTHALIWWLAGNAAISSGAKRAIDEASNSIFVSAASAWEIATKHRLGKLPSAEQLATDVAGCVAQQGFKPIAVTLMHGQIAGSLPGIHGDPFDRMLIAQAMIEDLVLVSNERVFDAYGVKRLW